MSDEKMKNPHVPSSAEQSAEKTQPAKKEGKIAGKDLARPGNHSRTPRMASKPQEEGQKPGVKKNTFPTGEKKVGTGNNRRGNNSSPRSGTGRSAGAPGRRNTLPRNPLSTQNGPRSTALTPITPQKNELAHLPANKEAPARNGKKVLRIIPLGGLGEVGKNIMAYEYGDDMFVVDVGLAFPNDDMLGVDIVLPDFTYLVKNKDRIRGICITHGHEDHIGGLAYLLKNINVPVYTTRLTIGLIEGKLKEHGLLGRVRLHEVKAGDSVKLGAFSVEFIAVNHSIPDACSLAITTPVGTVIQTGDFKVDYTPIDGKVIDLARFGELGSKGILALLSDSTNSEKSGSTGSEQTVGESFERLFARAEGRRMIIATFASNVYRVQQIVDKAAAFNRKVALSGRSMINVCAKALDLGYLKDPGKVIIELDDYRKYPDEKLVIVTTGSQGEPLSALSRMAAGDHRQIAINRNDFIILSATPIPGNEKTVGRMVNDLMEMGAEVIYERSYEVHVSGHACQEEQKLMLALTKPQFFMPVHGEFKHLRRHANTGVSMGVPEEKIIIAENGDVVETDGTTFKIVNKVQSGSVLVDGLGVGDVGSVVLKDRKTLSEDGLIIVVTTIDRKTGKVAAGPDIVSRGFVYVREADELMNQAKKTIRNTLNECAATNVREWGTIKNRVRDELGQFVFHKTKRRPMVLPVIMEV